MSPIALLDFHLRKEATLHTFVVYHVLAEVFAGFIQY